MAYIIGSYDKYSRWDREHSLYTFFINGVEYAIKEVILNWGVPQLPSTIEEDENPETYHLYDTYDDAYNFVKYLRTLNK